MKLALRQILKLYSASNVCFYKICDLTYDDSINYIFLSKESIMLQAFNIIIAGIMIFHFQPQKNNLKKLNKFYNNNNIEKILDFIFITITIIFIKNIENAI